MTKLKYEPDPNSGCWLWTGAMAAGGYGCLRDAGKTQKAHRYSYRLHNGDFPKDMKVCHKCDTPACVNPAHLFLGTQADNVRDMIAKGRMRVTGKCGEQNGMSVLFAEEVAEIRAMIRWGMFSQREIADSYGVSPMTISRIANNQAWIDVTENWPLPSLEAQRERI